MEDAIRIIEDAIKEKDKRIFIRHLGLDEVPEEIGNCVDVEDLSLIGNNLEKLPDSIVNLKNLKRLHLSSNNFEEIPEQVFRMPSLRHLCIRQNRIKHLPPNLEDLMHIRDLDVDSNFINFIPLNESNIDIVNGLSILNNPLIDPPYEILFQGVEVVKVYLEKKGKVLIFTINMPNQILTPFKQYLLSFNEFVKTSKGRNINIEVKSIDNGILVEVEGETADDIEKFQEYMNEYAGFLKQSIDDIEIKFEVQVSQRQADFLKHQMKQEIQILKMKCDNAEFKVKYLEETVDTFKQALIDVVKQPRLIHLDMKQLQAPTFINENKVVTNVNNDIEKLKDLLVDLIASEVFDNERTLELEELNSELEELSKSTEDEIKKSSVFQRIKDFISNGTDVITKTDKGFDSLTSLIHKFSEIANKVGQIIENINL